MQYLMAYCVEGETFHAIASMREIAHSIGCADFLERENHRIWRLIPGENPQPMEYSVERKLHRVYLYDKYGNFVESGEFPEH